jgi:signal transduction histidine kinase
VTIRLHCAGGEACLLIQDNGHGFEAGHSRTGGHGLANMQARARGLGGNVRVESAPGSGTRVLLTLPLQPV